MKPSPLPLTAAPRAAAPAMIAEWQVTPAKAAAAVERIAAAVAPRRILAFGSRARGEARPESDLDLLIILPRGTSAAGCSDRLHKLLGGLGFCKDLIVLEEERFEEVRHWFNSVYCEADREGITLYADGTPCLRAIEQVGQ